ncbi:MAG: HAMP domain-containing histidine kinase [Clostridia bacterium]|nr:HAMP domain-containing histidine kinase [Clostridia bacterium]
MKQSRSIFRWSFRSHVVSYLVIITMMSGLATMIVGSFINRNTIIREMAQSEQELAMTLTQLDHETDLLTEELLTILERTNLETFFVANEEPALAQALSVLGENEIVSVADWQNLPVTYVRTSRGLVCIMPSAQYNLYASMITRVLSVGLFFMAAFILLSLLGSKRISHPITELTQATRRISAGDFTVRVPDQEKGEVGDLMRSFNQMTEALEQNADVQKDFISAVSHEFKTPIASIKGYARLLSMPELTGDEQQEYIHMIASETDRLARLSDTMLRLTALERQNTSISQDQFSLDEQVRQVIVRMQTAWQNKEILWDLQMESVTIVSDSALLEQVWTNLIQNAVKFSSAGSSICIHVWNEHDEAFFSIQDHGIGMTDDVVQHIFDPFYQADKSRSGEGVGLGLSLVRRILNMVNGQIRVESKPGEGSFFMVTLPIQPKEKKSHSRS